MALRLYKSKMYELQSALTDKATKAHNGIRLCASLSDGLRNTVGSDSRLTEIMEEASSLPILRIENIHQNEINKIVGDIGKGRPTDELLKDLFKTLNSNKSTPSWVDLFLKVTNLGPEDTKAFVSFCHNNGIAEDFEELIESALTNSTWIKAPPNSDQDTIQKIDPEEIEDLVESEDVHTLVKQLLTRFCVSITNNPGPVPEIGNLFPQNIGDDTEEILLSDQEFTDSSTADDISPPDLSLLDENSISPDKSSSSLWPVSDIP